MKKKEVHKKVIPLTGQDITVDSTWCVAHKEVKVELSESSQKKIQKAREYIENRIQSKEIMYGINTGFGHFSEVIISSQDIEKLQQNIIRSHSVGVGEPFTPEQTRAMMYLRANSLSRGHSGCHIGVVHKILEFLNKNMIPVVPQQGSVGASGDLAPLAHLALALMGEGFVWWRGEQKNTPKVLQDAGMEPLKLYAKDGLSLINGCQVMTAVGLLNCYKARRLAWMADLAGALSLEALKGTRKAFDPLIAATRPHPGEAKTARNLLKILGKTSPIAESHIHCHRVQDVYSLRCIPAVHGAFKDTLFRALETLETEANSSTDNPLVFAKEGKVLSCGNFHGEPVAFVLDFMAIATSAMASMSECRISKLINPAMSGLPAFLTPHGGLHSGMMMVQVAAASLVSENKILSHPASVDSIPTSADKEDHVSMGTIAARKLQQIIENAENIVAMEILCASQALGFHKPLESSGGVKAVYNLVSEEVPFAQEDRVFSEDIKRVRKLIDSEEIQKVLNEAVGNLEI